MINDRFQTCLKLVWDFDGLKTDAAPGEHFATTYGVTQMSYAHAISAGWVTNPFEQATVDDCEAILWHQCWLASNCPALRPGVDLMVFNDSMLSGGGHAFALLSRVVGGNGPGVITLANSMPSHDLIDKIADGDEAFYATLKTAPLYLKGWTRRTETMRKAAHAMVTF